MPLRWRHILSNLRVLGHLRLGENNVEIREGAGAPVDGTSGTGAGDAGIGSLFINRTDGSMYQNVGTKASPTWVIFESSGNVARGDLTQDDLKAYGIPLSSLRQADQAPMGIVGTAGDHFFQIVANAPHLLGNTPSSTTVTDISTFGFALPAEYVAGETIVLRIGAEVDAVADLHTLDLEAYLVNRVAGTVGADINETTIKTVTATAAAFDFTITPTGLVAGDLLHFLLTTVNQDADGSDGIVSIFSIEVLADVKG